MFPALDYNTQIVLVGSLLLGLSAGAVGTFLLLRKRSLLGDVVSHATLPGIAIAFLVLEIASPGSGRSLPGLLVGGAIGGLVGAVATLAIRRSSRIKEDAALAIVLSVMFGLGIALFTVVQRLPSGNQAGLRHFIYGKAASMIAADVQMIALAAAATLVVCVLLFKEFAVLCFDDGYAAAQGWPVAWLDVLLMGLVVGVTVIGLQAVGLLLVVAMLIIPAAAARFWTENLPVMAVIASLLGGASAVLGVLASAEVPRLAAGAIIVLAAASLFLVSMLFGTHRGLVRRLWLQALMRRRIGRHDLLRAIYESLEAAAEPAAPGEPAAPAEAAAPREPRELAKRTFTFDELAARRNWTPGRLRRLLLAALREQLVEPVDARAERAGDRRPSAEPESQSPRVVRGGTRLRLTAAGMVHARRIVRNHRLWELYLITCADMATSRVDRDADLIEHVLDPDLVADLQQQLDQRYPQLAMPPSPHAIEPSAAIGGGNP